MVLDVILVTACDSVIVLEGAKVMEAVNELVPGVVRDVSEVLKMADVTGSEMNDNVPIPVVVNGMLLLNSDSISETMVTKVEESLVKSGVQMVD